LVVHHAAARLRGFNNGRLSRNLNHFADLSGLQNEVEIDRGRHIDLNVAASLGLESFLFDGDLVRADGNVGDDKTSLLIARGSALLAVGEV